MTSDLDLAAAERPEPAFGPEFRAQFAELLAWRRDVRRFRRDPLPDGLLERLLELAELAPSVGLSQPWRFVRVVSDARSEEHTSELQSPMRISYDVFCLKTKN